MIDSNIKTNGFFTGFLKDSKPNVSKPFTTLKWLKHIDSDSLKMLDKYLNNFEEKTPIADVKRDEVDDILTLVQVLDRYEREDVIKSNDSYELVVSLIGLVALEGLRRKAMIDIEGSGKISDDPDNTYASLTEFGVDMQEVLKQNESV